jgi:hypothetical protein
MSRAIFYFITSFLLCACVSVPEQAIVSQELVLKGLEIAERNQIALINDYADEQIDLVKKFMPTLIMDQVLKKKLNGRSALPADEVKQLIIEYAEDLNNKISKIETKRRELLKVANENYGELINLTKSNLSLTRSLGKTGEEQQKLLDNYMQKFQDVDNTLKLLKSPR